MVRARGIKELGAQQRGGRFLFWNGHVRGMSLMSLTIWDLALPLLRIDPGIHW